ALTLFIQRSAVGYNTGPSLNMERSVFHDASPQHDATIHASIRGEIADAASISAACFRLQLGNNLAGPHVWRTAYCSGREPGDQRIKRVFIGSQRSDDIGNNVHDMAV